MRRLAMAALLLTAATAASAQTTDQPVVPRPFRPIFGAVAERPNGRQALDVSASLDQAFGEGDARLQEGSWFPDARVDVQYRRRTRSFTFTALGGSSAQYYTQRARSQRLDRSHNAGATLEVPVGTRTRLRVGQSLAYATFYTLSGIPGATATSGEPVAPGEELIVPGVTSGAGSASGWQQQLSTAVQRQLGRRGGLEARYGLGSGDVAGLRSEHREWGVRYTQGVTPAASLVAGYSLSTGGTVGGVATQVGNVDLGIDYRKALSKFRNTTVAFTTGSAIVKGERQGQYRILADARLVRLIGRTWTTTFDYNRGFEFMNAFGGFVAADTITTSVGGFLSRSLEASASTSYTMGSLATPGGGDVTTTSAAVRVEYGFTRSIAVDAQYNYYAHDLGGVAASATPLAPALSRQRVRAGLRLWFPALR